ncbi:MAG: SPOR domain-containing protein, partial [Pseudomonadota bacterium]
LDGVAPDGAVESAAPSAARAAPAGAFGVQIASYKQRAAAERGWTLLSQRYSGLLDAYQSRIVEAQIPGRGRFFRLVAVGGERPALAGLCDQIQARGGACLLRRL